MMYGWRMRGNAIEFYIGSSFDKTRPTVTLDHHMIESLYAASLSRTSAALAEKARAAAIAHERKNRPFRALLRRLGMK